MSKTPPSQVDGKNVTQHQVTGPGRVDLGLMADAKGNLALHALHITGVNPGIAEFSQFQDGQQWGRKMALVLPDKDGNFDFVNLKWNHQNVTISEQYSAPDLWVLVSLNDIEDSHSKVPKDYGKYYEKTHSCVDVAFTSS